MLQFVGNTMEQTFTVFLNSPSFFKHRHEANILISPYFCLSILICFLYIVH